MTKPKVTKTTHVLPFDRLDPKDFERLCLWLADAEGYINGQHIGLSGKDRGRDIIAYKRAADNLELWYFQAKRKKRTVGEQELKREVDKIVDYRRKHPIYSPVGIIFVAASSISGDVRDNVTEYCSGFHLGALFWALTELDLRVKKHDAIVREFFNTGEHNQFHNEDYRFWLLDLRQYVVMEQLESGIFELDRPLLPLETHQADDAVSMSPIYERRWLRNKNDGDVFSTTTDFAQLFETSRRRVLLLGEPGAGKTTTLMLLARTLINRRLEDANALLPIYVPLSSWRGQTPLTNWIQEIANLPPIARDEIIRGRVVLLLDGFDEIPDIPSHETGVKSVSLSDDTPLIDPTGEHATAASLHGPSNDKKSTGRMNFLTVFHQLAGIPILLTCRENDYERFTHEVSMKLSLETAVSIQPLSDERIEEYLTEYPGLWSALKRDTALIDIVRTPLMLRLFTDAYSKFSSNLLTQTEDLVKNPGEIKDQIIKVFIERRYEHETLRKKHNKEFPTLDEIYRVLGKLAVTDSAWTGYDPHRILTELLNKRVTAFIDTCCEMHIIRRNSRERIEFTHLLIRDYFAFPILMSDLEQRYVNSETIRGVSRLRDRRAVRRLTELLSHESINSHKREIVAALGEIGDTSSVPSLLPLLTTTNDEMRRATEWALEQCGAGAKRELIQALAADPIAVRASVAWVIARLKIYEAVSALIDGLKRYKERIELPFIAPVSGYLDLNLPWLNRTGVLLQDIHREVEPDIYAFCGALTNLQDSSIVPLIDLYQTAELPLKQAAIWSLARMKYDERVVNVLISALEDPDHVIRSFAAAGLGWIKAFTARNSLIVALNREHEYSTPSGSVYCSILWALGCIADDFLVSYLLQVLVTTPPTDKYRQYCIVGSLGISGNSTAFDGLLPYLQAEDNLLRSTSAQAISRLRLPAALPHLTKLMFDPDFDVQRKAATGIAMMRNMAAAQVLVSNLQKVGEDIHYYVLTGLIHMRDKRVLNLLYPVLETGLSKKLREGVERAIKRIEHGEYDNQYEDAFFIE